MHEEELEYAGFWVRVGASLIDSILIILVTYPVLVSIYGWNYFLGETGFIAGSADFLITWVLPAVAIVAFWKTRQATPGKILISAKIVDADSGLAPSTGQCIGRYLAYIISTIPLCLGFLWVAFDRKKQGWHDKLAGTVVVRQKRRRPEFEGSSQQKTHRVA